MSFPIILFLTFCCVLLFLGIYLGTQWIFIRIKDAILYDFYVQGEVYYKDKKGILRFEKVRFLCEAWNFSSAKKNLIREYYKPKIIIQELEYPLDTYHSFLFDIFDENNKYQGGISVGNEGTKELHESIRLMGEAQKVQESLQNFQEQLKRARKEQKKAAQNVLRVQEK